MTPFDLRQMSTDELQSKIAALTEDLFKIKFQHATSQLSDTSKVAGARRDLARAKTILRERELEIDRPKTAAPRAED